MTTSHTSRKPLKPLASLGLGFFCGGAINGPLLLSVGAHHAASAVILLGIAGGLMFVASLKGVIR